jgi:hypothetical protein
MALIELVAATELMLFSCSWAKRSRARKQQMLMGRRSESTPLSIIDKYLKRKTTGASRAEVFIASQLARVCRRAVHTRSLEYVLLHVIRTAVLKRRSKLLNTQGRVL